MKDLIIISQLSIGENKTNTVSARDLHSFLGVKRQFTKWIDDQVSRARLIEGRDFLKVVEKDYLSQTGQTKTEYHLTLEAGKHIAMLSGTDKGFEVREYFIECERIAKQPADPMQALNDPAAMRGLLLTYTERVLVLEDEKKALTPKAAALDRISTADGLTCITDTAKTLQVRPKDLFAMLSRDRWIYRRPGGKGWIAYQDKIQQGLLTHKVTTVTDMHTGMDKVMERVLVTPKGLTKLTQSIGGAQQ